MKKFFLVAVITTGLVGVTLAQTHPSKKTSTTSTTKTEMKRDSVGGATASHGGMHKMHHKKGTHKKS